MELVKMTRIPIFSRFNSIHKPSKFFFIDNLGHTLGLFLDNAIFHLNKRILLSRLRRFS